MLPALAANPSARQRFLREARAAAAIKHDHIVTIYQVGEDRGAPFLAMEFLEGESLSDRLQHERRLPVKEVLRIGREMADGLAAAHMRGLIHRDVKPGNVWLEGDRGRVKILDFGLARAAEDAHLDDGTPAGPVPDGPASSLTQQGAVVGTPAYMAPEQADGRPVDARSDLFSLGCVLYRMAVGEPPFKGKGAVSMLLAVATETPAPPRRLNPDLPASLCDLITRLLSKKAEGRPPSAQAVVEAIRAIEQDETPFRSGVRVAAPARTAAPPRPPTPAAGSSWRVWVPVAAVVLLGMLAYAAYLFGPAVVRYASGDGELVIEIDDPQVQAVVDQTGVTILDKAKDKSYTIRPGRRDLKAGDYELVVKEVGGDMRLFTKEFTITRGGVTSVKVTLAANPPPAIPAAKATLLYSLPFWDAQQGFPASIFSTGISSDGRLFFGAGDSGPKGTIRVWDLATGEQVRELVPGGDTWNSVAQFVPGGKYLVATYSLEKDTLPLGCGHGQSRPQIRRPHEAAAPFHRVSRRQVHPFLGRRPDHAAVGRGNRRGIEETGRTPGQGVGRLFSGREANPHVRPGPDAPAVGRGNRQGSCESWEAASLPAAPAASRRTANRCCLTDLARRYGFWISNLETWSGASRGRRPAWTSRGSWPAAALSSAGATSTATIRSCGSGKRPLASWLPKSITASTAGTPHSLPPPRTAVWRWYPS